MNIEQIAALFGVGDIVGAAELKNGHINRTFLIECSGGRYILQSLNHDIFKFPEIIMENADLIGKAFLENPDCGVRIPDFLRSGGRGFAEINSEIWRMYGYIEPSGEYSCYAHGFAVGRFLRVINSGDFRLKIPMNLHDFDFPLPVRNIHGDTKADNIIFGKIPAVIDLDTASRGYAFVDFGDMLRSVTSDGFDMNKITEAVKGFAEGVGDLLTDDEVNNLAAGTLLVITELSKRYIEGKKNFPNKTQDQCLERLGQLTMQLDDFHRNEYEISSVIRTIFGKGCD